MMMIREDYEWQTYAGRSGEKFISYRVPCVAVWFAESDKRRVKYLERAQISGA